jgi:hypothetical protein
MAEQGCSRGRPAGRDRRAEEAHEDGSFALAPSLVSINTPGPRKGFIISAIVLFANDIPPVVVECKDANNVNARPMDVAFQQLMRYNGQQAKMRPKPAGLRAGSRRRFSRTNS